MTRLLANPEQRQQRVLQLVCGPETNGNCLNFGQYVVWVKSYFDNFKNLQLVQQSQVQIIGGGVQSANGIVVELPFVKHNYRACTVLKIAQSRAADNLIYEYIVGVRFINKFVPIFPCFLETYGLFSLAGINLSQVSNTFLQQHLIQHLNPTNVHDMKESRIWEFACLHGKNAGVMIQHCKPFITFKTLQNHSSVDIPNCLYQVYFVLKCLQDEYNHNDLHRGNVLLYQPFSPSQYIQFSYHFSNGDQVVFPCQYMVKIIDYGRNRFPASQNITDLICGLKRCEPNCGRQFGFDIIAGENRQDFVNTRHPNYSIDLRLANGLSSWLFKHDFLDDITYQNRFGTPSIQDSFHLHPNKRIVSTVTDMELALRSSLDKWNTAEIPAKYRHLEKKGELRIFEDRRPMEWVPL